jgi:hypothetical protein
MPDFMVKTVLIKTSSLTIRRTVHRQIMVRVVEMETLSLITPLNQELLKSKLIFVFIADSVMLTAISHLEILA